MSSTSAGQLQHEKAVLVDNYSYLANAIVPEDILPEMFARKLITKSQKQKADSHLEKYRKNQILLDSLLARQEVGAFQRFCDALSATSGQEYIADRLKECFTQTPKDPCWTLDTKKPGYRQTRKSSSRIPRRIRATKPSGHGTVYISHAAGKDKSQQSNSTGMCDVISGKAFVFQPQCAGNTQISQITGESGYSSRAPSDEQSCSSDEQVDAATTPPGCTCGDCRSYSTPLPIRNGAGIADTDIELLFGDLVTDTCISFARKVKKDQILLHLKHMSLFSNRIEEVRKAENIEQLFDVVSDSWSWYNISLLEILINKFGDRQDKERLEGYCKERTSFLRNPLPRSQSEFSFGTGGGKGQKLLRIKISKNWDTTSLEQISQVHEKIAVNLEVPVRVLYLSSVSKGCICLNFVVAEATAEHALPLSESQKKAMVTAGVFRLECGNYVWQILSHSMEKIFLHDCELKSENDRGIRIALDPCYLGHANSYALEEEDKGYEGSAESDGENDGAHSRYSQGLPEGPDVSASIVELYSSEDDEGCEHAAEQNMITKGDEQMTKSDHTRAVQHVTLLNCDQPATSESTADPDKNSAIQMPLDTGQSVKSGRLLHLPDESGGMIPGSVHPFHQVKAPSWSKLEKRMTLLEIGPVLEESSEEKCADSLDRLSLALEPEAAAIFCHEMPKRKLVAPHCETPQEQQTPYTYLIVDIGGGTVDISRYALQEDPFIEMVHPLVGNDCGGLRVNNAFKTFFKRLCTSLHLAAEGGHVNTVKYLVEKGAEISSEHILGNTPLDMAAGSSHEDVVSYRKRAADPNMLEENESTGRQQEQRKSSKETVFTDNSSEESSATAVKEEETEESDHEEIDSQVESLLEKYRHLPKIKHKSLKCLFTGQPRVGKTTLKKRLLRVIKNLITSGVLSPSGGLKKPISVVIVETKECVTIVIESDIDWKPQHDLLDEAQIVLEFINQSHQSTPTLGSTPAPPKSFPPTPVSAHTMSAPTTPVATTSGPDPPTPREAEDTLDNTKKLMQEVLSSRKLRSIKDIEKTTTLYFMDTDGQPEFHEIMSLPLVSTMDYHFCGVHDGTDFSITHSRSHSFPGALQGHKSVTKEQLQLPFLIPTMPIAKQDPLQSLLLEFDGKLELYECESPDSYYFFPALHVVQVDCTTDVWQNSGPEQYQCGLSLQCSPPQFLHLLLLRLAFSFAFAHDSSQSDEASPLWKRRWKNGILWPHIVETIVDVSEQNKCILLLMSCPEGEELHLHSLFIPNLLEAKEELCPKIFTNNWLMDPSNLTSYPLPELHQQICHKSLFSSVISKWLSVCAREESPYTWDQVLKVLYQPAVRVIANELKKK